MIAIPSIRVAAKPASRLSRLARSPQRSWQFSDGAIGHLATRVSRGLGRVRGSYAWQKAITTYGRTLGRTESDNFLVLGASRSGTTAMVDYLNCNPRICCRGEILNSDYFYYGDPRGMNNQRLKLHVESFFVKRPGLMAGAKILTYQLDEMRIGLADFIEILRQPRIVVLYRQQILEQYASLKLAERSGVWHSNKPARYEPIWLDPSDFVAFAERERRMWRENLVALQRADAHFVTYEQLCGRPRTTMRGVFEFLGLECCPVEAFVARLHDRPPAEKVANHRQLLESGALDEAVLRLPFRGDIQLAPAA